MLIFKIIFLQLFWFLVIFYGKIVEVYYFIFFALFAALLNYFIYRPNLSFIRYVFLIMIFSILGLIHDFSLVWLGFIPSDAYTFSFLSLWIIFISYYGDVFNKISIQKPVVISLLGAVAGPVTYWSAMKLGAIHIIAGQEIRFLCFTSLFWAVFFPVSLNFFYKDIYWDKILDKLFFLSFDRTGYLRHKKKYSETLYTSDLSRTRSLITGGTSGIGESIARQLVICGSQTFITGRNSEKGKLFTEKNPNSRFISLDISKWDQVQEFCKTTDSFDNIVLNAGGMPHHLEVNDQGVEYQCASQLIGHYCLIESLRKYNKINSNARIVWVSSGGMYLKKLNLDMLFHNTAYDKVSTYANVKRAQVTLVEELAQQSDWQNYLMLSMHPGWVNTEGLKASLPNFFEMMKKRLRFPEEGADTVLWLLLTRSTLENGGFYFDRKKVSPYWFPVFNPTITQRRELLNKILDLVGSFSGKN